jgi:hypothetical protein
MRAKKNNPFRAVVPLDFVSYGVKSLIHFSFHLLLLSRHRKGGGYAAYKQEPLPKERLRALLVEQSGEMMTEFLPVTRVVVKLGCIVLFRRGAYLDFSTNPVADSARQGCG